MNELEKLAALKRLPIGFLYRAGFSENGSGILIDYGPEARARIRKHASSAHPTFWISDDDRPMRVFGHRLVPYMGEKLGPTLLIVEGETDAATAILHGRACIGIPGKTMVHVIQGEDVAPFARVIIVREPGAEDFTAAVAKRLRELGFAGDISEFSLAPHKDLNALHVTIANEALQKGEEVSQEVLDRFAAALDDAVAHAALVEPMQEPEGALDGNLVEAGETLLAAVEQYIKRFVKMGEHELIAVALWAAHTHAFEAAEATPYLQTISAEKSSGKTRLCEVLELIVARPWFVARTTPAALYRKIASEKPTLLLDESDAAFKSGDEYSEALRGILNSGYRKGGKATVCVGQGAKIEARDFATFCPKLIAGLRSLPDTIADRSIRIELKRKMPAERVERFHPRKIKDESTSLRDRLAAWGGARVDALKQAEPQLPDELSDRGQDIWEPLLAIADDACGEWPQRARAAARALSSPGTFEDESLGVQLLDGIRSIYESIGRDRISSAEVAQRLNDDENAPWGTLEKRPFDARTLAKLLRRYKIRPKPMRIGDDERARGYERSDFDDAFARYLPPF